MNLVSFLMILVIFNYSYQVRMVNPLLGIGCNFLAYIILLPFEELVKSHYIKKAKVRLHSFNNMKIIGITGSFGKTSMKNYLKTSLEIKYKVCSPEGNVNTLMGITKYINNHLEEADFLILELGIDQVNQMEKFSQLITLDYAFITSIGNMHLATFKNIDNVVKEKLKIANLLKEEGVLFINEDCPYLKDISKENTIKYSQKNIKINSFNIDGINMSYQEEKYLFPLHTKFFASYLDGIIKLFIKLKDDPKLIFYSSKRFSDYSRRNQVFKLEEGYLIDNSYNANIEGIKASLMLIDSLNQDTLIVLGGIIEQGRNFIDENNKLKDLLKNKEVLFIGSKYHPLVKNHQYKKLFISKNINCAYKLIRDIKPKNILLLCKGDKIYLR